MELKDIGINPDLGGAVLVTYGTIAEHRNYTAKDGTPKYITELVYMGGNQSISTPADHPIRAKGEGELVLIAQTFQENRFGWKAVGHPVLVEQASAPQKTTKTPTS